MSNITSKTKPEPESTPTTAEGGMSKPTHKNSWGPVAAIFWALLIYLVPQVIGSFVISIYPSLQHWGSARTSNWLANAVSAQFAYTVVVEALAIWMVGMLLAHYKSAWKSIGLVWPKVRDIAYALSGFAIYLVGYALLITIVVKLFPSFDATQQQNVGFQNTTTSLELLGAFISLVILPPLAEEIIFRGFLYKGLRRKWNVWIATIGTSVLFAAPHLIEGVGGLLWVGALDTFILSIVLCLVREKTGRLAPGMGIHALKNGLAFASLFILHAH